MKCYREEIKYRKMEINGYVNLFFVEEDEFYKRKLFLN